MNLAKRDCSTYKVGHLLRYNFSTLPNKAICKRCKQKFILNLQKLEWEEVKEFIGENRTDEELIIQWNN
jgi:hypothetical protein